MTGRWGKARSLLVLALLIQGALIIAPTPARAAAPQTTILSGPSGLIARNSASFRFKSSLRGSTFQCKLDAGKWGACTSPKTYSALKQGAHTFRVRAKKKRSVDKTPAVRGFTVDTIAPQTTVQGGFERYILLSPAFSIYPGSSEAGTLECRYTDDVPFAPCTLAVMDQTLLPDRIYTFEVRARDLAGNVDPTPATHRFGKVAMMPNIQETGDAAAEHLFPDELAFDVPASCPGTECPNGIPNPPEDQLGISTISRTAPKVVGQYRFDVSATTTVTTLAPINVNVPLAGDCQMTLNSAPGATPTWSVHMPLHYTTRLIPTGDNELHLVMGDVVVNGVESDDVALTGGIGCQLASVGISFFIGTLVDSLQDMLQELGPLCMAPGPAIFEQCPWFDEVLP
jgi:hypothetical protein